MSGTTFRKLRLFGDVNLVLELRAGFMPVSPDGEIRTVTESGVEEIRYFTFEWNSQIDERNIYSIEQLQNYIEEYLYGTTRLNFLLNSEVKAVVYAKALNPRPSGLKTLSSLFPKFLSQIFMGKTTIVLE
jgi:hypothetical protein